MQWLLLDSDTPCGLLSKALPGGAATSRAEMMALRGASCPMDFSGRGVRLERLAPAICCFLQLSRAEILGLGQGQSVHARNLNIQPILGTSWYA
jgi:hypothetical protein